MADQLATNQPTTKKVTQIASSKYCECCKIKFYTSVEEHITTKKHQEFATNDSNYNNLDAFIERSGLGFDRFLAKYKK